MKTYNLEIGGQVLEVVRDVDGKFIIPERFRGTGTALKPAFEPIVLARKPLSEKTVAANVLRWGTGALNIDGCRVPGDAPTTFPKRRTPKGDYVYEAGFHKSAEETAVASPLGRWPANVVTDGSDEVVGAFPTTHTNANSAGPAKYNGTSDTTYGKYAPRPAKGQVSDSGSAARFFYSAKASRQDRDEGLDAFAGRNEPAHRRTNLEETADNPYLRGVTVRKNTHPTVKPTALMQWLCRLITPPGGTVLDPFMGSGSTGKAAVYEGFKFVGCEREEEYIKVAEARIAYAITNPPQVAAAVAAQQPANDNNIIGDLFNRAAA